MALPRHEVNRAEWMICVRPARFEVPAASHPESAIRRWRGTNPVTLRDPCRFMCLEPDPPFGATAAHSVAAS
jgi:hypothetical protein